MTSTTVDTYMVASDHYEPVNPLNGSAVVKVLTGDTVYYNDKPYVTSTTNLGSLTAGQSATFTRPAWLLSASLSSVSVTITDAADDTTLDTAAVATAEAASVLRDGTGLPASVVTTSPSVGTNGDRRYRRRGGVTVEFDPLDYGVLGDAVVDPNGNLVSGTDDTTAWGTLIADLAAKGNDRAFIPLHGVSLVSSALGFDTSRLTMIGNGPHTGFYLADNSNSPALRFNTDPGGAIVDPVLLNRLHLERFAVYGNGYAQSDYSGIGAAVTVWAYRDVRVKNVHFYQCKATALYVYDFRSAEVDHALVDTIVIGGAANGINFSGASWTGWQSQRASVTDSDFIDVPNESVFLSGVNEGQLICRGNKDSYRNLRPRPASITGYTNQWQNVTQTATAYSAGTNYTVGQWVSSGGFNYLAVQANGPGSTVVAPGSNQLYWWLQNRPVAWSSGTAYVNGQCAIYTTPTNPGTEPAWSGGTNYAIGAAVTQGGVPYVAMTASGPGNGGAVTPGTNSAVWQASFTVPGGFALNFTALAANTNVAPVTANLTLNPNWQLGGPLYANGANGFTMENNAGSPTLDVIIAENQGNGRNTAGEVVGENGVYISTSAAGIATRGLIVARNTLRGYLTGIQAGGDMSSGVDDNIISDCSSGILYGDLLAYSSRSVSVSRNKIRLGALGKGTGMRVEKAGTNTILTGLGVDDNEIDGGSTLIQLSSALTNAGGPYTALPVLPLETALLPGQQLLIGTLMPGVSTNLVVTVSSAGAAAGAASIPVNSFTPSGTLANQTLVFPLVSTLTATVTSGVAITSISVTALPFPLQSGQWIFLFDLVAGNFPTAVQVAPAVNGVPVGATSVPINSITPSKTYSSGYPIAVLGNIGLDLIGGLQRFHANRNHIRYVGNNLLNLSVLGGTPQAGALLDNWGDVAGNACFSIGSVGTSVPVRFEGGGWTNNIGGNSLPSSGVAVRKVYGTTPARDIAAPAVPATGVSATMPIYDGVLAVTGAAGGATTISLGTTTQGSTLDTATITVPASTTVLIPVLAGQKVQPAFGGGNAPTWTFFAQ